MANRHKAQKKNVGGGTVAYAGGDSNVAKEAKYKLSKRGGKVHGKKGRSRFARGGRTGSDKAPFSSAHVSAPAAHNPSPHKG